MRIGTILKFEKVQQFRNGAKGYILILKLLSKEYVLLIYISFIVHHGVTLHQWGA